MIFYRLSTHVLAKNIISFTNIFTQLFSYIWSLLLRHIDYEMMTTWRFK